MSRGSSAWRGGAAARWLLPALWLLLASGGAQAQSAGPTVVVDDRGQRVVLAQPPQRIVSLLPSLTETVCALQACGRLVGTDRHSNWPDAVQALPKLGGLEDAQIERIVALKPDLVLVALSTRATERLETLGLRVLALEPRNWADTRRAITVLAQALGTPSAGTALLARTEQRIDAAAARVPAALRGRTVYFEVAATPYAAGESSFIGELLARLGLGNVVPAAMGPFPQLNPEFVLRAQPGLVMATARAIAEMPARPGWGRLQALQQRQTCGFAPGEHDTLVRPGPRLADAAEAVADCLAALGTIRP
jgi:iron complex transport system substrate-binding protein